MTTRSPDTTRRSSSTAEGPCRSRIEASTNGTFVNGQRLEPRTRGDWKTGDRIQLGTSVVLKLVFLDPSDERFQHEMFERTVRDGMTGLYNRAYFLNQVGGLSARHAAQGIGMAILMMDVDHFKRVNDRYGHLAGDSVLRGVAQVIRESTRTEDLVARYGGEEFVVALPVSSPDLATERAERIRSNLAGRPIRAGGGELRVTVSIGLAFASALHAHRELELIEAADQALYQAKSEGRNRVVLGQFFEPFDPPETESAEIVASCSGLRPESGDVPRVATCRADHRLTVRVETNGGGWRMPDGHGNVWDIRSVGMTAAIGVRCDSTDRGPPHPTGMGTLLPNPLQGDRPCRKRHLRPRLPVPARLPGPWACAVGACKSRACRS